MQEGYGIAPSADQEEDRYGVNSAGGAVGIDKFKNSASVRAYLLSMMCNPTGHA